MVVTSMQWRGTPYVVSFFLALNLYLIAYEYRRWKYLVVPLPARVERRPRHRGATATEAMSLSALALCLAAPLVYPLQSAAAYTMVAAGLLLMIISAIKWRRTA